MSLFVRLAENTVPLDYFTFNKETGELAVKNVDAGVEVRVEVPFNIKKLPDKLFEIKNEISYVFLLKNRVFSEHSIVRIKFKNADDVSTNIGFIFSLRSVLESDTVLNEPPETILPQYAIRALVALMNGMDHLPAKSPEVGRNADFTLLDFYDEDVCICAISKEQLQLTDDVKLSLLAHLNLYGFYLVNKLENLEFTPEHNNHQQRALEDILSSKNYGTITCKQLSRPLLKEPYFKSYFFILINHPQTFSSKFLLIYQCYEIILDLVTKLEIQKRVCAESALEAKSGYHIKELVFEVASESYRMRKLFDHYCDFLHESNYHVGFEIYAFLKKHLSNFPDKEASYGGHFYELRNTFVHNFRMLFAGNDNESQKRIAEFSQLVSHLEFLTVEVLVGLKQK